MIFIQVQQLLSINEVIFDATNINSYVIENVLQLDLFFVLYSITSKYPKHLLKHFLLIEGLSIIAIINI